MSSKTQNNSSKIPKYKSGCCIKQRNRKQNDSSYMQLNITKVYFLKKRKKNIYKQENLDDSVTNLAKKISALCNKIKHVESCVFLGRKFANTQLELKPTGNVDIIRNNHNIKKVTKGLDKRQNSKKKEDIYLCELETKRHRNCFNINESTSELFCPSEFSFENMWNKTVKPETPKPEFILDESEKRHLKFILEELSNRTEEIMKKIQNIDIQIQQMCLFHDFTSIDNNCQYCKSIFEELIEQKRELRDIVHTLKDCINDIPEKLQYQKQVQMLIASFNAILHHENKQEYSKPGLFHFRNEFLNEAALHCVNQTNTNITESKSEGSSNVAKPKTKFEFKDSKPTSNSELRIKNIDTLEKCASSWNKTFFINIKSDALDLEKNSNNIQINKSRENRNDVAFHYNNNLERGTMNEMFSRSLHHSFEKETFANSYSNNVPEKDTNNTHGSNLVTNISSNKSLSLIGNPVESNNKLTKFVIGSNKDLINVNRPLEQLKTNDKIENTFLTQEPKSPKLSKENNQKTVRLVTSKCSGVANNIEVTNIISQNLAKSNIVTMSLHSNCISSECGDHDKQIKSVSDKSLPNLKENNNHTIKQKSKNTLALHKDNDKVRDYMHDLKCSKFNFATKEVDSKIKTNLKQRISSKLDDKKIDKLRSMLQMNARNNQVKDNESLKKDEETMLTDDKKIEEKISKDVQCTSNNELSKCTFSNKSCQYESDQFVLKNKCTSISQTDLQSSVLSYSNNSSLDINIFLSNFEELLKNEMKLKKEGRKIEPALLSWKNKSLNSSTCTSETTITDKIFDIPNISQNKNECYDGIKNKKLNNLSIETREVLLQEDIGRISNQYIKKNISMHPFTSKKYLNKNRIKVLSKIRTKRKEYTGISKEVKSYKKILQHIKRVAFSNSNLTNENVTNESLTYDIIHENELKSQLPVSDFHSDFKLRLLNDLSRFCSAEESENVKLIDDVQKTAEECTNFTSEKSKISINEPECIKEHIQNKNPLNHNKITTPSDLSVETNHSKRSLMIDDSNNIPSNNDKNDYSKRKKKYILCIADSSSDILKLKSMGYKPIEVSSDIIKINKLSLKKKKESDKKSLFKKISQDILQTIRSVKNLSRRSSKSEQILDLGLINVSENTSYIEPVEMELDRMMNKTLSIIISEEQNQADNTNISPSQPEVGKITTIFKRIFSRNK